LKGIWAVPIVFGIALMMTIVMPLAYGERQDVTCVQNPGIPQKPGTMNFFLICPNELSIGDHVKFVLGDKNVQRACHLDVLDHSSTTTLALVEFVHSIHNCDSFIGQQGSFNYDIIHR